MSQNQNSQEKVSVFLKPLNEEEIDYLKELGNIGSGRAANSLADLLKRKIVMNIPRFHILTTQDLSKHNFKGQSLETLFVTVSTRASDNVFGLHILMIFDEDTVRILLPIIRPSTTQIDIHSLGAFDESILKEVGNILALKYLVALNKFSGKNFIPQVPDLLVESTETILTTIASYSRADFTHIALIESDIFADNIRLSPLVVLIPEEKTIEDILKIVAQ